MLELKFTPLRCSAKYVLASGLHAATFNIYSCVDAEELKGPLDINQGAAPQWLPLNSAAG